MASSANLGALNSEWSDLAGKIGGLFYSPGSASDVAARRAQNGQDGSVAEQPVAPPVVVGQKPAAPIAPAVAPPPTPSAPAPTAAIGVSAPSPAPAPAVSAGKSFTDMNTPGAMRAQSGATALSTAPVAAPVKALTMNPVIMEQQQALMAQIAAAQGVVQAGSNRDGYKMGDVTKALATMNHLSPLISSSNNLMGATYGVDAGMVNHAADNATRLSISDAGNQTELAKTDLAGQYGVAGHEITAQANMQLAQQKAQLEALSPAGQKALVEARTAARNFDDTAGLTGAARVRAVTGKAQDFQQVKSGTTGNLQGIMVDGNFVPMLGADAELVNPQPKKKK